MNTVIWICTKTTMVIVIFFVISKSKVLALRTAPAPSTSHFGNKCSTTEKVKFYPQTLSFCKISNSSLQTSISKAWAYIQKQYGPFEPDIDNRSHTNLNQDICVILSNETEMYPLSNITNKGGETSSDKALISEECSSRFVLYFKTEITLADGQSDCPAVFLDEILTQIATMVMVMGLDLKSIDHWPAKNVSGTTLTSILVYDIYSNLEMKAEAEIWKELNWNKSEIIMPQNNSSRKRTFWFRDWYFPIYVTYENSTVLKDLLTILRNQTSGRREKISCGNYEAQINIGEFIHLWSGAARANLKGLATRCFDWSQGYQMQLEGARKMMHIPTYDIGDDERNFEIPDCGTGINLLPIILGIVIPATFVAVLAFGLRLFKKVERRQSEDRDSLLFQVNYDDLEDTFDREEDRRIRQFLDDRFI